MKKPLLTKEFTSPLVLEYSAGPSHNLGVFHNRMSLIFDDPDYGHMIVWNYGKKAPNEDETVIGLGLNGRAVTDYDGVFELPREARELLIEAGFSLHELGYDKDGNEIPL
jgi:hypothetical protein